MEGGFQLTVRIKQPKSMSFQFEYSKESVSTIIQPVSSVTKKMSSRVMTAATGLLQVPQI